MSRKSGGLELLVLGVAGYFIINSKPGKKFVEEVKQVIPEAAKYFLKVEHEVFLKELNPQAVTRFRQLIAAIEKSGYNVIITSGQRSFAKQAALNAENSKNAKPGYSLHNYGLAIDVNLQKGTKLWRKSTPKAEWESTGVPALAKKMGFRWGGDIPNYYDPVHFDIHYDTKQLLSKAVKQFGSNPATIQGNKISLAGLPHFI